jgi:hypothetical protein
MAAGVTHHRQTIDPRKPEVGHDEIRVLAVEECQGIGPGVGAEGGVADALKEPLAARDKVRLVVDHQDRPSHRVRSPGDGTAMMMPGDGAVQSRERGRAAPRRTRDPWGMTTHQGAPCPTCRRQNCITLRAHNT